MLRFLFLCTFFFPLLVEAELITNGDFSAGNSGFTSSYTFLASGDITGAGEYTIVTDPSSAHPLASSYGDNTDGFGNMLMVNGATTTELVWAQTVSVDTNTIYEFSAFVSSWFLDTAPASLDFIVNGSSIGTLAAPDNLGLWLEFSVLINSGASTSFDLEIYNLSTQSSGNDFAIDDISLTASVPEPSTLLMFLMAVFALRKR
ncbi:PEP-CTERM sorting domain-containing protein [Thalassomonas viridans]|uniref:PEP-CTERM sorting domain-containing protein n=1 Tax=Thalassomonas viridans TaxID=137584 RepID=A0AAE9Z8J5_9GAMM|nr:PEP-CTERM sorting domain-containing protein [Thalassomonas viridans]WDE08493.1 PEP-CTERM sorting domain-containing protein [Thalassomonas viridans]